MNNSPENVIQTSLKCCWICFVTDEDDAEDSVCWISPCRCQGISKWVHQECLQRWIDENQQGSSEIKVSCPQCNTEYIIVYPKQGLLVNLVDKIEYILSCSSPFVAGGFLVGYVYWTAVTYGAITIIQILGHRDGLDVMEKTNPLILLISLPTIPIVLIFSRMIKWQESILKFWRKHIDHTSSLPRHPTAHNGNTNALPLIRLLCGGLILPTFATILGKLMFRHIHSNFQRAVLGGITFIVLKGILKIYYKQNQYIREAHREILNYGSQFRRSPTTNEINQSHSTNTILFTTQSNDTLAIPTDQSSLHF